MNNLLPNLPPGETEYTFKLLSLIADPDAAKKRLAELVAQEKSASDRQNAAVAAEQKANDLLVKADTRHAELDRREKSIDETSSQKLKVFSDREVDLNNRQIELAEWEKRLSEREQSNKRTIEEITARESSVSIREQVFQNNCDILQKSQDQWKTKVAALRATLNEHFNQ